MDVLNLIIGNSAILITVISLLAFLVSVITQVTKNLLFLKNIPTDLQVVLTSISLCLLAYFSYTSYSEIATKWYFISGTFVMSFVVAYVAIFGWSQLNDLYTRLKK